MKRLGLGCLILLVATMLATSCSDDKGTTSKSGDIPEFAFAKTPTTAVISSGTAGWPIFPSDPCVIKDNEGYHFFSLTICCASGSEYHFSWDGHNLGSCDIANVIGGICYAFSSDQGLTWQFRETPVLTPGPEDWQSGDLETPYVQVLGDTVYMFYSALGSRSGVPFESRYQIGAAILELNGRTLHERLMDDQAVFNKRTEPLLPYNLTSTDFDNNTQEPSVVVRNGLLELYYVGVGFSLPNDDALASGQSITSVGMAKAVFDPNLNVISNSNGYILNGANITEVKYFDDYYHVFSTSLEPGEFHNNEKINYFASTDGVNWGGPEILLTPGSGSAFDSWGMMAPTVVVEDSSLVMFYTAWLLESQECFPEPFDPNTRFGMPFDNDTKCIHGSVGRAVSSRYQR